MEVQKEIPSNCNRFRNRLGGNKNRNSRKIKEFANKENWAYSKMTCQPLKWDWVKINIIEMINNIL